MSVDILLSLILAGLILGFSIELGKLVFRIFVAFLVRPKSTPRWPWTENYKD